MNDKMKRQGLVAGISLILMAMVAGFAYGYAYQLLVVDDAEVTLQNLRNHFSLYLMCMGGWVVILITDLIVTVSLYRFFRSTHRAISFATASFRLIYSLLLVIAIAQLVLAIPLIAQTASVSGYSVMVFFERFEFMWSVGLIVFGFHLLGLGVLTVRSQVLPRWLGYLLWLGGMSYILIHGWRNLPFLDQSPVDLAEQILSAPMALAELLLAGWLIYYGFRKTPIK